MKIPRLPYGEGTMSEYDGGVLYKKSVEMPDGTKKRLAVRGKTPQICLQKMRDKEEEIKNSTPQSKEVLCDAMYSWMKIVKKKTLKSQSYDRLEKTIRNQIEALPLGHYRYQSITTDELQEHIDYLNEVKKYSHSTIKKTYDALNDFYRYVSAKYHFENPMLLVTMPIKDNIAKREDREILFFEQEDIDKFIKECQKRYNTGSIKYIGGCVYGANIYMGLRIGELLALTWDDIDWDKNTIIVNKTLIQENNPDYDEDDSNSKKVRFVIQPTTKTHQNRYVPLNNKAKELLLEHKKRSAFTKPNDFIICTRNRKTTTEKNADDIIKRIQLNAGTTIQGASSHALRHTCASLYFRKGISIEIIAKILGHSVDVCRNTYLHFIEEQLKDAASQIDLNI